MLTSAFLIDQSLYPSQSDKDNTATVPIPSASSCGQRQQQKYTFGWSDLPCEGDYLLDLASLATTTATPPTATHWPTVPAATAAATEVAQHQQQQYQLEVSAKQQQPPHHHHHGHKRQRLRVRFCPFLQVRTYNVTIGSHPWCRGGMALECDWSHTGTEFIDLNVHEEYCSPKRRLTELHLNLHKRRARLQQVTGLSLSELIQQEHLQWAEERLVLPQHTTNAGAVVQRLSSAVPGGLSACAL